MNQLIMPTIADWQRKDHEKNRWNDRTCFVLEWLGITFVANFNDYIYSNSTVVAYKGQTEIVITDENRNKHYRKMLALKDPSLKYDEDDAYYIEDLEVFVEWANQTVVSFFTLLN